MEETVDIYLGLGSNMGDRHENVLESVRRLDVLFGRGYDALSSLIETEPWGFEADTGFVNAVVRYKADVPRGTADGFCLSLLDGVKRIEAEMGRTGTPEYDPEGRRIYRSRIIDIDILLVGDYRMDDVRLTIPHPLMQERDFVMIPLREILRMV